MKLMDHLPIDDHIPDILDALRRSRAVVVTAEPGAGKTTRVPPALVIDGPVLVLQPRRVAARAIAQRIAFEQGWALGKEVGWQVRYERRFSAQTKLLVATEGILTARLQADRELTAFRTVVLDEFHERSIHADLGLALCRIAWRARPDFRLVIMSATIDADRVSAFLDNCPIVRVPGRAFALDVSYRPGVDPARVIADEIAITPRALLCFLPGAPEIRKAADAVAPSLQRLGIALFPLHGGLSADEQDLAIQPGSGRRVILATNLAETTLTVPDVTSVVDTGLQKVARYDAARAIDSLEIERVSQDSADQRAGRAGRVQAGRAVRLWDPRDRLRPHREPEIARVDLAATMLDVFGWGGDPGSLEWFDPPPRHAVDAAIDLLGRLGAIDRDGRVLELGRRMQRLPLHPRLSRLLLDARGAAVAARACALLSERHSAPARHGATVCDLLSAVDRESVLPPHVLQAARNLREAAREVLGAEARETIDETSFRRAVLAGYPDRVAKRRAPKSPRFVLVSGTGAQLARESGVHDAEFIVAVDLAGRAAGTAGEAIVRLATAIERDWLAADGRERRHSFDAASGRGKAVQVDMYGSLSLAERPASPDAGEAARILAAEYLRRGLQPADEQLVRRLQFAGLAHDVATLVERAAASAARLDDMSLEAQLSGEARAALARLAPVSVTLAGGGAARLDYRGDDRHAAAAGLQQLLGVTAT